MRIISSFKDYYDYVAHVYGGGDPKIIYDRRRLGDWVDLGGLAYAKDVEVEVDKISHLRMPYRLRGWEHSIYSGFHWLIVCGRPYPLVSVDEGYSKRWEIFSREKHQNLIYKVERRSYRFWSQDPYTKIGEEDQTLVNLSKVVGHPVFIINHTRSLSGLKRDLVIVDGNCPILGPLGLPSLYPAEQIYQDLSYFIVNKMKDSPDVAPRSPMTDLEKVAQHGFDVKKSFRHRK